MRHGPTKDRGWARDNAPALAAGALALLGIAYLAAETLLDGVSSDRRAPGDEMPPPRTIEAEESRIVSMAHAAPAPERHDRRVVRTPSETTEPPSLEETARYHTEHVDRFMSAFREIDDTAVLNPNAAAFTALIRQSQTAGDYAIHDLECRGDRCYSRLEWRDLIAARAGFRALSDLPFGCAFSILVVPQQGANAMTPGYVLVTCEGSSL